MQTSRRLIQGISFSLFAMIVASSCVDEKIVFRDRELFEDPPAAAQGFLGYTDAEAKLTVCGNCHVGQQSTWEETAHAGAWAGLQDSGHAQSFCEGCHTVNELGNSTEGTSGYAAFADVRYEDVQCESCHGPGLDHVENPSVAANHPLAPIEVGADLTFGCGECHEGTHHPFASQWELSGHGEIVAYPAGRSGCNTCHEGKAAMVAFGVNNNFIEKGSDELLPITCAVCHDPHERVNEAQLRFSPAANNLESNLCAQCHNRRQVPDPESSHGLHPHSPSAALVFGEAGWVPPGADIGLGSIQASHGSEQNERLCATCHVVSEEITDAATGEFLFQAVGHTFRAIPCVDEQGIPTGEDCTLEAGQRSFAGCTGAGCHLSQEGALGILTVVTGRMQDLHDELHDLLVQVDPGLEDEGGEIDARNPVFTVAEGAFFNMELAAFGGAGRPSARLAYASSAVHNPFYMEELLRASIRAVEQEYGVSRPDKPSALDLPRLSEMNLSATQ